jgi:hypothetical protein
MDNQHVAHILMLRNQISILIMLELYSHHHDDDDLEVKHLLILIDQCQWGYPNVHEDNDRYGQFVPTPYKGYIR